MEKVLELLKSLKFLEAVCYTAAVLVLTFAPDHAIEAGALLGAVVAVLKLFGIQPELRVKAFMKAEDLRQSKLGKAKK
jgi:hypothetical protein